jgi:hypothetical protein
MAAGEGCRRVTVTVRCRYDVLVDLSGDASVVVSEHAKAYFGMTSVHKDAATGATPHFRTVFQFT